MITFLKHVIIHCCLIWLDRKYCRWTCAMGTLYNNIYLHRECCETNFICCLIMTAENLIWLVVFSFAALHTYIHSYIHTHILPSLHPFLSPSLPTYLLTYLPPTNRPTYLTTTHLPTYLPTCLPTNLPTYQPIYLASQLAS